MSQKDFIFDGFEQSNTTPVPDIFFDKLLSKLSGAEIKVLLYIIRRTAGFKKTEDAISLTQFEKGIVKAGGIVLDEGCGLSRETICKTLDSLEAKGYIKRHKRNGTGTNNDVSLYSIRFKGEPQVVRKSDQVVRKSDQQNGSQKNGLASQKTRKKVVRKSDPQETVIQQTEGTYGNGDSAANENALSFIPSLSFLSDEELLAELHRREMERLSTPEVDNSDQIVDNQANGEILVSPVSPIAMMTTGNASQVYNCDIPKRPDFSPEEGQIQEWWCAQKDLVLRPPKYSDKLKEHWSELAKYVHSLEEMTSLCQYTKAVIKDNPSRKDKTVYPGNLVDCLDRWKQSQPCSNKQKEPAKVTVGNRHLQPISSLPRL